MLKHLLSVRLRLSQVGFSLLALLAFLGGTLAMAQPASESQRDLHSMAAFGERIDGVRMQARPDRVEITVEEAAQPVLALMGLAEVKSDGGAAPRQVVWRYFYQTPLFLKRAERGRTIKITDFADDVVDAKCLGVVYEDGTVDGVMGVQLRTQLDRQALSSLSLINQFVEEFQQTSFSDLENLILEDKRLLPLNDERYARMFETSMRNYLVNRTVGADPHLKRNSFRLLLNARHAILSYVEGSRRTDIAQR